jgi:serine/threonine protein kinase
LFENQTQSVTQVISKSKSTMIGQTVSHYRILEKMGEGGMGVVYKAQDLKLERWVALKFLPSHMSADEEEMIRFVREAKAASALDHPNIGTIHEIANTDDGQMFIVMAYYEGETLKQKIERGPLPVKEAVDIAIQIARGLAKAHSQQIVHRDIKPGNLVVTREGLVKIIDFGLAKLGGLTKITKTHTTMGKVSYYVAGAGSRGRSRPEGRRLVFGGRDICDAHRPGSLPGRAGRGDHPCHSHRQAEPAQATARRRPGISRADRAAGFRKGFEVPLRLGG